MKVMSDEELFESVLNMITATVNDSIFTVPTETVIPQLKDFIRYVFNTDLQY